LAAVDVFEDAVLEDAPFEDALFRDDAFAIDAFEFALVIIGPSFQTV
jgi:hypothetical protein